LGALSNRNVLVFTAGAVVSTSQPIRPIARLSGVVQSSCCPLPAAVGSMTPIWTPVWALSSQWLAWLPSPRKEPVDMGMSPSVSPREAGKAEGLNRPPS
jgi:hypothetical protein